MAIVYIVLPPTVVEGAPIVSKINTAIYNLTRPASLKQPGDVTSGIFPWFIHPTTGQMALQIITDYVLYLHQAKNPNDLLKYYTCPQKEKKDLADLLTASSQIEAGQLIASDFVVKTHEQMVSETWFEELPM